MNNFLNEVNKLKENIDYQIKDFLNLSYPSNQFYPTIAVQIYNHLDLPLI